MVDIGGSDSWQRSLLVSNTTHQTMIKANPIAAKFQIAKEGALVLHGGLC